MLLRQKVWAAFCLQLKLYEGGIGLLCCIVWEQQMFYKRSEAKWVKLECYLFLKEVLVEAKTLMGKRHELLKGVVSSQMADRGACTTLWNKSWLPLFVYNVHYCDIFIYFFNSTLFLWDVSMKHCSPISDILVEFYWFLKSFVKLSVELKSGEFIGHKPKIWVFCFYCQFFLELLASVPLHCSVFGATLWVRWVHCLRQEFIPNTGF